MTALDPVPVTTRSRRRARRPRVLIRLFVVAGALAAIGCTRLAADDSLVGLELLVVGLALVSAVAPDNHIGLLVVWFIGLDWVLTVDDPTTPWSIGVAVSLAVSHTSTAAASVAPPVAPWTPAMARRWIGRLFVVAAASVPTWAVAAALDGSGVPGSPALLVVALTTLAAAALWARQGELGVGRSS